MKGYKKAFTIPEPVTEMTLVGCRRCDNTWREERTFYTGVRQNSAIRDYDYCDKCITSEEIEARKPKMESSRCGGSMSGKPSACGCGDCE